MISNLLWTLALVVVLSVCVADWYALLTDKDL